MGHSSQEEKDVADIAALVRRAVIVVFGCALVAGSTAFFITFRSAAYEHVQEEASALMDTALAIRAYTVDEVRPKIRGNREHDPEQFHEQTVPSYAAQAVFQRLDSGGYSYREAALNPTNPDDRATAFEADLIKRFRDDNEQEQISGTRQRDGVTQFYQARPIRISAPACLACHSTPERAPEPMLTKYGRHGGFGWELGEVVGIQMLTVPIDSEYATIYEILAIFFAIMVVLFAVVSIVVVRPLQRNLIRPLRELADATERASLRGGDEPLPEYGAYEVRRLSRAVARLRRSLRTLLGDDTRDEHE